MKPIGLRQRFWSKVPMEALDTCWNWKGRLQRDGYGRLSITSTCYQVAHRVSWELNVGPIPDGLLVCHRCDNRACVNPRHLFLGTHKQNTQDAVSKGRMEHGERRWSAKLTEEQVREIRKLHRTGATAKELAREYGVSSTNIGFIVTNKKWVHVQDRSEHG